MLALHGCDAVGRELSPKGAEVARTYAVQELAEPHDYNFGTVFESPVDGPGSVSIVAGDFFDGSLVSTKFDIIYDYTDWARRMRELLAPTGVLFCLKFPLFKGLDEVGPPWPLQDVYRKLLADGGPDDGAASLSTDQDLARSLVRAEYFKPARSYPNGKGTDMESP
ncbi:hypothetical protein F5X68DRAFT_266272 [Plectosphaerella plurivora]|uniref:Uncharacterized protein n=1 Tax=Plectosphaerella plurivora TaxID=936078 RepID=A0A9P8V0L3_9PEZI|nr:hypothetical protein F5X68DRAFT_266272 [Plectosphaerella plurivora]